MTGWAAAGLLAINVAGLVIVAAVARSILRGHHRLGTVGTVVIIAVLALVMLFAQVSVLVPILAE